MLADVIDRNCQTLLVLLFFFLYQRSGGCREDGAGPRAVVHGARPRHADARRLHGRRLPLAGPDRVGRRPSDPPDAEPTDRRR